MNRLAITKVADLNQISLIPATEVVYDAKQLKLVNELYACFMPTAGDLPMTVQCIGQERSGKPNISSNAC